MAEEDDAKALRKQRRPVAVRFSSYSMLLYLNDDFQGGATTFFEQAEPLKRSKRGNTAVAPPPAPLSGETERGVVAAEAAASGAAAEVREVELPAGCCRLVKVVPLAGDVLVFPHGRRPGCFPDPFHAGAVIQRGRKTIIRTDVMFAEASSKSNTAKTRKGKAATKEAEKSTSNRSRGPPPLTYCLREEARRRIPGPHIFDVSLENINDYCCGSFWLVERDLRATLPTLQKDWGGEWAGGDGERGGDGLLLCESAGVLRGAGVEAAFTARENLVSFKKVAFHLHRQAAATEKTLTQLATFFWDDSIVARFEDQGGSSENNANGDEEENMIWVHSARLTELCNARSQCRGAAMALQDVRTLSKHVCCLHRHPEKAATRPAFLAGLPGTARVGCLVRDAVAMTKGGGGSKSGKTRKFDQSATPGDDPGAAGGGGTTIAQKGKVRWRRRVADALALAAQEKGWPEPVLELVRRVLVVRGADKALRMCDEMAAVAGIAVEEEREAQNEKVSSKIALARDAEGYLAPPPPSPPPSSLGMFGVVAEAEETIRALEAMPSVDDVWEDGMRLRQAPSVSSASLKTAAAKVRVPWERRRRQQLLEEMRGAVPQLRDMMAWVATIVRGAEVNVAKPPLRPLTSLARVGPAV